MIKLSAILICAILLSASGASAQEKDITWGMGMGLSTVTGASFHIPILFASFRIEPEVSFRTSTNNSSFSNGSSRETFSNTSASTSQTVTIASGFHYLFRIDQSFLCYCGPRIGMGYTASTSDNTTTETFADTTPTQFSADHATQHNTTFFVGASLGAEYYFSKHFTIGGELLLTYSHTGTPSFQETKTQNPANGSLFTSSPSNSSNSSSGESTAIFLRWYF